MLRLPIATGAQGRAWARRTFRAHRGEFVAVSGLLGLATVTGLAGPQILGSLVDSVAGGGGRIDLLASLFVVVLLAQTILRRYARVRAGMLGERVLAETRENFVGQALRLPLGTVEAAGTGDLLSRATTDADRVDFAVRQAFPEVSVAVLTVLLIVVWAYGRGLVSLGTIATMAVYIQGVAGPLEEILWWMEDMQVSATALRRILGVEVARSASVAGGGGSPRGQELVVRDVRYGY